MSNGKSVAPGCSHDGSDAANAMWGGRFATGPAEVMAEINASIDFDKRL